jgi:hypothetical protein
MKLKSFNEHLNEAYNPNDERFAKLRKLGLADEPEMDDRMHGLQDEWMNDEEITRLVNELRKRTSDVIHKWFPVDDPIDSTAEQHFEEYIEMLDELGPDELGFLEYMVMQYNNGYL